LSITAMADLSDVEDALVACVTASLYPNGADQPSVLATEYRIYRGWPTPTGLNADLAAGTVNVTVFPGSRPTRILTPLPIAYAVGPQQSTFSATTNSDTVTFAGTPSPRDLVGLLVDRISYQYRPQSTDTAAMVAAAFFTQIRNDRLVRLSGQTVTIPGVTKLVARVFAQQSHLQEARRQERDIVIACWAPSPPTRDLTAAAIDVALSGQTFLSLSDGTSARIQYLDTTVYDRAQNAQLYRRDLIYSAEYPTVSLVSAPPMLFGDMKLGETTTIA
jgi:hypothetical protein